MLDPFSDRGEEDSGRQADDLADLDRWALCIQREEGRVCRARAALAQLGEQRGLVVPAAQAPGPREDPGPASAPGGAAGVACTGADASTAAPAQ
eukprot:2993428-Lingulodinium_polyedra.AAC.1